MRKTLSFFLGKKIFITGHTGFKGSWLTYLLSQAGAEVMGYALPAADKSHFNDLRLAARINHISGDIRDANFLKERLNFFKPEFVFHLAAQALVRKSYLDPLETFEVNIQGSANLLEATRGCSSIRSLIYVTSDKCYENNEWIWGYRENDRLGGRDPYSASKAAAEIIFSAFQRSYFEGRVDFGAASVRAGNVIGGGDWSEDRIVPDCIRAIIAGEPIILRSPNATRPWQHVLEPISAYLCLARALYLDPKGYSGSWNFGPISDEIRTVKEVAEKIIDVMKVGTLRVADSVNIVGHEAKLLQLNCDKAHSALGWRPRWGVDETIRVTAEWYKDFIGGRDIEGVTRAQINAFLGAAND